MQMSLGHYRGETETLHLGCGFQRGLIKALIHNLLPHVCIKPPLILSRSI